MKKRTTGARRGGRTTKLTRELTEKICSALSTGAPVTVCAKANGIHRDTYYAWVETGLDDMAEGRHTLHAEFAEKVARSVAQGELSYWEVIRDAAQATKPVGNGARRLGPDQVRAKVQAAKVALAALRTRWGRRYNRMSQVPGRDGQLDDATPPAVEKPKRMDFTKLTPDERRELLRLLRIATPDTEE